MRFLYTTDLHGDVVKYNDVLSYAVRNDIKIVHLGADLLPKGSGILSEQKKFVKGFLKDYYADAAEEGITLLAFWGNDDLYTRKKYFLEYASLLDENPVEIHGFRFIAYPYVPDYPFGLKTGCKLDSPGWEIPERYISTPVEIGEKGFQEIKDVAGYFKQKGTIEEDLAEIDGGVGVIAAIHCPPTKLGLDVCYGHRRVGSRAVYNWIEQKQPRVVLCGHIHESPKVSGMWRAQIGKSVVVQPGQNDPLGNAVMVYIKIDKEVTTTLIV